VVVTSCFSDWKPVELRQRAQLLQCEAAAATGLGYQNAGPQALPHSDCFWPDAEQVLVELNAAGADDADIDKITWGNSCRFFGWDPFARMPREQANVAALRAKGADVDVSIRPRKEWARLCAEKRLAKASQIRNCG
jgi:hypothetical protein